MEFQVLGSVGMLAGGQPIEAGPPRQRCVLVALLAEPNQVVSSDELVDRVWGEAAPYRARATLRTYLSRLRGITTGTESVAIGRRSGGYVLTADMSTVDLHRFHMLVRSARAAEDGDTAAGLFGRALALWRGEAFAGLDTPWINALRERVETERIAAELDHAELRLRHGQHGELVAELENWAVSRPLDERVAGQLMLALCRSGRQADALARYTRIRSRLAEELGIDPRPELRDLQLRILAGDPGLSVAAGSAPGIRIPAGRRRDHAGRPWELPPDTAGFIGRTGELAALDRLLESDARQPTAVISAVSGTAGVGKTALAIHWAHRVAARFPDGQLYVNLRGYDPGQPMRPTDVLAALLRSLGLPDREIPEQHAERVARYRTLLAGREVLVLLDNARGAGQVRDLLPGTAGSLVLVTSRDHLAGLAVHHGVRHIELDLLPTGEARELLRTHIGDRVDAEPHAAAVLAKRCAYLPLALRIAAQQAASRPTSTLAALAGELTVERDRLDLLDAGDPYSSVRTVFFWSYRQLPAPAATVFRLLGLHPGRTVGPHAVAAMAALDLRQTRQLITVLRRAHLIHETARERYSLHDLLHAYASELAASKDSEADRRHAATRLLDYYLHAAQRAAHLYTPYQRRGLRDPATDSAVAVPFHDHQSALAWLDAERDNLLTVALHAADHDQPGYTSRLSLVLFRYLDIGAHYADAERLHAAARDVSDPDGTAPAAANYGVVLWRAGRYHDAAGHYRCFLRQLRRSGDRGEKAGVMSNLGAVYTRLGRYRDAARQLRRAVATFTETGDPFGEGIARDNIGTLYLRLNRFPDALDEFERALVLYHRSGSLSEQACAHSNLGLIASRQDRHDDALAHHHQALAILGTISDRQKTAEALNRLGITTRLRGEPRRALGHHREALTLSTGIGDHYEQAVAHESIAGCHHRLGDASTARAHWRHALALHVRMETPDARRIRAALAGQTGTGSARDR